MTRAKVDVEILRKEREALIVTEIPYQVNKATLIEKIAELVRDKRVEGISDLRDESDRDGMRIVIELKRDAVADIVLNQLWRFTALQSSFACNMIALNGGRPEVLTLKDFLTAFIDFREEVVTRRTKHLLTKARDAAHLQVGLAIAVANIDEVIRLIRTSADAAAAREALMSRAWPARDMAPLIMLIADPRHVLSENGDCRLSEAQARANSRIASATADRARTRGNRRGLKQAQRRNADYLDILRSRARLFGIIKDEMLAVKTAHATPRRTIILDSAPGVEDEDLIQREDMVVTVSHHGYIKRFRSRLIAHRGAAARGEPRCRPATRISVARLFVASTHTPVLFFSSRGQVYKEKVWRLPLSAPQARGKALVNILPLEQGERITTIMPLPEDEDLWATLDVMFATTGGAVRRNKLSDFAQVNRAGKIAMRLDEGEEIVDIQICTEDADVLLTTAKGQCIRFPVTDVRVFKGRDSMGVRGISLSEGDRVISLAILRHIEADSGERTAYLKMRRAVAGEASPEASGETVSEDAGEEAPALSLSSERYAQMSAVEQVILTLSANGYGKRTSSFEYRITGRGGKGIVAMAVNSRNGLLVASMPVEDGDEIILVTDGGQLIRCPSMAFGSPDAERKASSCSTLPRMSRLSRWSTSPRKTLQGSTTRTLRRPGANWATRERRPLTRTLRITSMAILAIGSRFRSEPYDRAHAHHQCVGNSRGGIERVGDAPARMNDVLKVRLDRPARRDSGLIGELDRGLVVLDRHWHAGERNHVPIMGDRLREKTAHRQRRSPPDHSNAPAATLYR